MESRKFKKKLRTRLDGCKMVYFSLGAWEEESRVCIHAYQAFSLLPLTFKDPSRYCEKIEKLFGTFCLVELVARDDIICEVGFTVLAERGSRVGW